MMKSIKGKILTCMTLTVVISLLLVGGIGIYLNISSTDGTLEQSMQELAIVASERMAKELEAYRNVAIDAGCIARLANPDSTVESKKAIVDQRAETHNFRRGNILDAAGMSIFDGNDYSERDYYQRAIKGESFVSEPLVSKITGELSIIVAAPLWEGGIPDTKVVGVVYFVPQETFLNDIVSGISVSANGAAYAINRQGVTIADNTLETVTTQNIEEEARSDSSLTELAAIHSKMRAGETGFGEYRIGGVNKFSAYALIPDTDGWSLGVTAPKDDFMGATYAGIWATAGLLALAVVVSVVIAVKLAGGIGGPIRLCAERLDKLAKGDLKSEIPQIHSKDETGILSKATGTIVSTMDGIITDLGYGLGELAEGNFTADSKAKELYIGDFLPLAVSVYSIIDRLNKTMVRINRAADEVAIGSDQVSAGAQALSQGATEQASSVEELAATIESVSTRASQNAESAHQASQQAREMAQELETGKQEVAKMTSTMEQINDSSSEIGKIVRTIEDIAFQTNILALNAAVEAARAGAAGKGFAVVADEVRNLANKSQDASKNTTALIESTLQAVQSGASIAVRTAQSMDRIVDSSEKTARLVHEISKTSQEQAEAISQVTLGVDQISAVVQTNSGTAEESAAASEELNGQARMLKEQVGKFRLRDLERAASLDDN